MASPGLNPALFVLAKETAQPARGYEAAQWSNEARPSAPNMQKYTQDAFQSVFISEIESVTAVCAGSV